MVDVQATEQTRILVKVALLVSLSGCVTSGPLIELDPCEGVTCSGQGTCVVNGTSATCDCNPGYEPVGLTCAAIDPCEGVTCSGQGICVVNGTSPTCDCNPGYEPVGLTCIAIDSGSGLDSRPSNTTCLAGPAPSLQTGVGLQNWLGEIDDIRIYGRSLTENEIKELCDE